MIFKENHHQATLLVCDNVVCRTASATLVCVFKMVCEILTKISIYLLQVVEKTKFEIMIRKSHTKFVSTGLEHLYFSFCL